MLGFCRYARNAANLDDATDEIQYPHGHRPAGQAPRWWRPLMRLVLASAFAGLIFLAWSALRPLDGLSFVCGCIVGAVTALAFRR